MNIKCNLGWEDTKHNTEGRCCCNCIYSKKLVKHPWNSAQNLKGSISEQISIENNQLFACVCPDMEDVAIVFDKPHGMCEMHTFKQEKN